MNKKCPQIFLKITDLIQKETDMSAKMIAERKDVPDENKWDLTPLFETDEAWEQLFSEVDKALARYGDYRGHLKDSVRVFKEAIEFHLGTDPQD